MPEVACSNHVGLMEDKMKKIKRNRWTKEEIKYLKENYKVTFYSDIAKCLGRTHDAVTSMATKIGLKSCKRNRPKEQGGDRNDNWKGGISKNNYHYKKIQVKRYPKRVRARGAVYDALKNFVLHKPTICEKCKKTFGKCKIEGHHKDYDKPLEVNWLCIKCHREVHKLMVDKA